MIRFLLLSFICFGFFCAPGLTFAQDEIDDLFKSGPGDATKLIDAYINPLFRGLGTGLNSGWSNTAKAKKPLQFDIRISATAAFVPKTDQAFDINSLHLTGLRPADPFKTVSPTAFGEEKEGPEMEFYSNGYSLGGFRMPSGSGFHTVPSPQVQLTLGLLKYMDLSVRFAPRFNITEDSGNIKLFGLGTKFELLPILMGKKAVSTPIDIALLGAYSRLEYRLPLNIENQPVSDQQVSVDVTAYNAEFLISKKLSFFTPFLSIGYQMSQSELKALGTFQFDSPTVEDPNAKKTYIDPIDYSRKDVDAWKASLGFQLNFGFFKFYSAFSNSRYQFFNAGIGLGLGQ